MLLGLALGPLVGCGLYHHLFATPDDNPHRAEVKGTVNYRQRIALGPSAELIVRMEDVTQHGQRPVLVAENRQMQPGQVPIHFELVYDRRRISPDHHFVLSAVIREEGEDMLVTPAPVPVLTQGHGDTVDLELQMLSGGPWTLRREAR
jgi:putative lipoprotein